MITVLYEDSTALGERNFGPHMLVLWCVADLLGEASDGWALRPRVEGFARKGNTIVQTDLRQGFRVNSGPLFAVFDNDKVRRIYNLAPTACKAELLDAIRGDSIGSPAIVLLEQNMEDVTRACCEALGREYDPTKKPKPRDRDAICHAAAKDPLVRSQVLGRVPSLGRLVRGIRSLLVSEAPLKPS